MRLIDADALMDDCQLAQKQADRHGREFTSAFYSGGGEISTEWWCVEDMIENARTIEERKWIPCSERLPENKQKCLLTTLLSGMKYVYVGTYATDLYSVNKHDFADRKGASGWYYRDSEYGYIEYNNVVAWMPLPEPYKPGKE